MSGTRFEARSEETEEVCVVITTYFQVVREDQQKTKTCSCGKECQETYECIKVKGIVDYGNGVRSDNDTLVTFYGGEEDLGDEV